MRTTYPLPNPCWNCNAPNDAVSDMEGDKKPSPGSVALCIVCGAPGVFTDTMTLRRPTDDEMKQILKDARVRRYWAALALSQALNRVVQEKGKKP